MLYLHKEKTQTININRTEGQPYPLLQNPMTLTLRLHSRVMGSAHQLTERDI